MAKPRAGSEDDVPISFLVFVTVDPKCICIHDSLDLLVTGLRMLLEATRTGFPGEHMEHSQSLVTCLASVCRNHGACAPLQVCFGRRF